MQKAPFSPTKNRSRYYLHRAKSLINMPSTWCYMRSLHVSGQIELCCLINCWHLSGVSSWRGEIICHTSAVSVQVSLFNTRGPGSQSCISPLSSKRLQFHFLLEAFPAHSTVRCNAYATIPAFVLKETWKAHTRSKRSLYVNLNPQSHPQDFHASSFRAPRWPCRWVKASRCRSCRPLHRDRLRCRQHSRLDRRCRSCSRSSPTRERSSRFQ